MGISQLYQGMDIPSGDDSHFKIEELKRLLKSLLLNFLEVVGVMSVAPQEFAAKVEHIRTILINIHHLLNEYRPHQSRESLILLLENQVETKKSEIKEIEKVCLEVEEKIKELVEVFVDGKTPTHKEESEESPGQKTNEETSAV
jgi:mediator of RNA polymerase II transcription subunit 7